MNKIYLIVTILALTFLTSCNDSFMERYPLDSISDNNYWKSENDLQLYCNSFYYQTIRGHGYTWASEARIPYGYTDSWFCYGDTHSDNGIPKEYSLVKMVNGTYVEPTAAGSGGWDWTTVRSLNYFLINYNKADISQSIKHTYAGEIMFFKAWEYFEKVKIFGEVPWLSKPLQTNSEELYAPRTPRGELMDSILTTIDKAISWLPAKGAEKADRLNKDMALLLKARICLYEGTFRKYHKEIALSGDKFMQEAIDACDKLMNSGNYAIWSTGNPNQDYNKLFVQDSYANNKEIILWKNYADGLLGHATLRYYTYNLWDYASCSKSMVEEYLCKDGLPISISPLYLGDDSIQSEFTNRDPRLTQTVNAPGEYLFNPTNTSSFTKRGQGYNMSMPNIPGTDVYPTPSGYRPVKYWKNDVTEIQKGTSGIMPCPIFRFAEVLLTYAEAKTELGKCNQAVLDATVNKLRDRVGMPHLQINNIPDDPKLDANYSKYCEYQPSSLLREIRRERRVELGWENFRWDDLVRWKAGRFLLMPEATQGMKFNQYQYPKVVIGKDIQLDVQGYISPYKLSLPNGRSFIEPKQYYFPIPIEDLVMNSKLVQNPGWKNSGTTNAK
jgi:hypothetical protein